MEHSPIDFQLNYTVKNTFITYSNLVELGQSGIQIGKISIDNYKINDFDFGGPLLYTDNYLFVPMYKRNFFKSGFQLAVINLNNYKIFTIGDVKSLVWLDSIDDNKVYFYEDIMKEKRSYYEIS